MNFNPLKLFLLRQNPLVFIVLLGSILRFAAFLSLRPWDPAVVVDHLLVTDQWSYNSIAISILNLDYGAESFWMPGWPAFIALVYSIFGETPWVVLFLNIGLGAITIIYFFKGVRLLIGEQTAHIAGFLLACDPHQIIYNQTLLTENLFLPVLMIFFYFLIKYLQEKHFRHLALLSVLAGSMVYIKSVALYFLVVPLVIVFFSDSDRIAVRLKKEAWIILIVLAVHTPMSLKNYINDGYWAVTSNGGFNALFIYAGSVYTNQLGYSAEQKDKLFQQKLDSVIGEKNTNQFVYDNAAKSLAIEVILKYPLEFLTNHISGCVNIYTSLATYQFSVVLGLDDNGLFMPGRYGTAQLGLVERFFSTKSVPILIGAGTIALILLLQYALALKGMSVLYKDRRIKELLIPLCFILYFTLITGVIGSSARFKLPITPFYLIFSSVGIVFIIERISIRKNTNHLGE